MADTQTANAIRETLISPNVADSNGENANVVDVLDRLARAVSTGLKRLGTGDAATPMGAIEAHALEVKNAGEAIAGSLESIATAINRLADSIDAK